MLQRCFRCTPIACFVLLDFLVMSVSGASNSSWHYKDQDQWNNIRGSVCKGYRQSPINIDLNRVETDDSLKLEYVNYEGPVNLSSVKLTNTGHNIAVIKFSRARAGIGGSALKNNLYGVVEVHWHWSVNYSNGSEHAIDGQRFAAEVHLFHRNLKYSDPDEARAKEDGYATLAILLELGDENKALQTVLNSFQGKGPLRSDPLKKAITLRDFLPGNLNHFYTYHGSKTTPNCEETNTWIIFKERLTISKGQLQELTEFVAFDNSSKLIRNNRDLQEVNDRKIYQSSGSSLRTPGLATFMSLSFVVLMLSSIAFKFLYQHRERYSAKIRGLLTLKH